MAKAKDPTLYVATDSFTVRYQGVDHTFEKGVTRVRAGHPVMVGREHMFEPIRAHYEWEAATAAPGETREAA